MANFFAFIFEKCSNYPNFSAKSINAHANLVCYLRLRVCKVSQA